MRHKPQQHHNTDLFHCLDTIFETDFMIAVLPDVMDIVKTKYIPEEYRSLIESLSLAGVPGLYESIEEGVNTPLEECKKMV